ncbi:hypothetical protein BH23VER1_BH23VER1_17080 [soil metagenome]
MNPFVELLTQRLGTALLHSLWQVTAAAVLLALLLGAMRASSASARCLVAAAALGCCLVAFVSNLFGPVPSKGTLSSSGSAAPPVAAAESTLTHPSPENALTSPLPSAAPPARTSERTPPHPGPIVVAAYLVGLVLLAGRHVVGCLRLRRLRLAAIPLDRSHRAIAAKLSTLPGQLGWPRRLPPLLVSARATVPVLVGLVRPVIMLPASALTGLSEFQLRQIVAHELAHLRRLDPWVNHFQAVAETLFFFHPAAWWISRQIRREREHACDDLVVRTFERPTDYARALLTLKENAAGTGLVLAATSPGKSDLAVRIDRILGFSAHLQPRPSFIPLAATALAAFVGIAIFAGNSVAAPDRPAGVRGAILDRNGIVLATSDNSDVRQYPLAAIGAHAVGTIRAREDTPPEGTSGIEKQSDAILSAGDDVRLTLDSRILTITDAALADVERAAVVVIDPDNGEILSLVSKPSVDLNLFAEEIDAESWRAISRDTANPLRNRAIVSYPPSLTFIYVTALSALQNQIPLPNRECTGDLAVGTRTFKCWNREGHGTLGMPEALESICSIYFYNLAVDVGPDALFSTAKALGFGTSSGIQPHEQSGWDFDYEADQTLRNYGWRDGNTMNAAVGFGMVSVTPVQIARMTCAIANGGTPVHPRLIGSTVENQTGKTTIPAKAETPRLPIPESDLATLRQAMSGSVNKQSLSAAHARSSMVEIAGTTGSGSWGGTDGDRDGVAWFTGFAPFENPELVVTILVEGGGSSSQSAAAIAKEILEKSLALR